MEDVPQLEEPSPKRVCANVQTEPISFVDFLDSYNADNSPPISADQISLDQFVAETEHLSDDDSFSNTREDEGHFRSAEEFLSWVVHQRQEGIEPLSILTQLVDNCDLSCIPDEMMWYVTMNLAKMFAVSYQPPRSKLGHVNTLEDVCSLIQTRKNIIVLSGAGISVSAGIPDFRSKDGIYAMLREEYDLPSPECMFDLNYFLEHPHVFYSFAYRLWPDNFVPTQSHKFISELEARGVLLNNYTQNIDNLESKAGVSKLIQCHGSFATATCLTCSITVPCDNIREPVMRKEIAYCQKCRPNASEKHSNDVLYGIMKPDIVFFGEQLPERFHEHLLTDLEAADMCIVMGSSLRVYPVAGILSSLPAHVPLVLINREVVGQPNEFDVKLLGDCDAICATLCAKLEWNSHSTDNQYDMFNYLPPDTYTFPGYQKPERRLSIRLAKDDSENSTPIEEDDIFSETG